MITDRKSDILKYLNNNGGLVSVAEIAEYKDFSGMSRRDINKALMELEKNGKIFKKIKDGKYYYTVKEELADAPLGYHTFLSKVSEGINQFIMSNDLDDDDDEEEVDLDEVISKLDDLISMLSDVSGDDENDDLDIGITEKNVDKIFDLTYKKKRTYTDPLNTYTFEIPDGFEYEEHPDDNHEFAVWYPDDRGEGSAFGLVTIYPSDTFQNFIGGFAEKQFESCKNSHGEHGVTNILARAIASAASFHLYGIYTSSASFMMGDIEIIIFPADRKICGSGYRAMRDDACTYFFWLLLDGKLVAFRVDLAVGNSISAVPMDKVFDGLCTILEHIHPVTSENTVRETDDNRYMSKAMTYKLAEEWVDEQLEKMNQMGMAHNLVTGAIMNNANDLGEDEESMIQAVADHIDMWFQYENKVCEKFAEQVDNVLHKQQELGCGREVMAKLCEHAEKFIDTPARQSYNINDGEYIVSVKSDKYEAIKKSAESIISKYNINTISDKKETANKERTQGY